jgi:primosomal protein N' (replication factor Y)
MAIARASHEKFPVILVSATPSLETVHNAKTGKYTELTLHSRHAKAVLPDIHLLDMRTEPLERGNFISRTLRDAVAKAVEQGHQAMLFLNRRGYAPLVLCRKCGHRFQCPDCSAWMVLHQSRARSADRVSPELRPMEFSAENSGGSLKCHHCAYTIPVPKACPSCGVEDSLHACGPGVERVHEEIATYLPNARVATLASDSTGSYREISTLIRGMENKEIDILIGTQMIAKGHHFADLSVVGVVDADLGLAGGDLRAAEKTYQLLHQISGRAGRESVRGHVYLQSYTPKHAVMQALVSGKRDAFFTAELRAREQAGMPPFSRLAALIIEGKNENAVVAVCKQLSQLGRSESHITIMGPAPAPLFMLRGQYRYRFLLKADRKVNLSDFVKQWVAAAGVPRTVKVRVDIDPVSFV